MGLRSWLFVPGDSERKLARAAGAGADALIVDLEDAVAPDRKPEARAMAAEWIGAQGNGAWVRINALDTPFWQDDLAAVLSARPAGIVLPKAAGPEQIATLSATIDALEREHGIAAGTIRIMPLVSETPAAALTIPAYAGAALPRLAGLTWGAEDLSVSIGATRKRDDAGHWTDTFRLVRAQVLLAAHACSVAAIDTLQADFRDLEGLERIAAASRADGFHGMLAIHPDQVPIINAAFTPGAAELAEAQAIIELFAANPAAGALAFNGRMVDQPHLRQAKRLLDSIR